MATGRVLDLFCKAGGVSMGLHMAGFDVYGIDIEPQPNYPFRFKQADALSLSPGWIRRNFDAVVGSPPCLGYTNLAKLYPHIKHAKLIPATRDLMEETGLPYIIENVENASKEMIDPIKLCGSSFGLRVRRHRLFETGGGFCIANTPPCSHAWQQRHKPYLIRLSASRNYSRESGTIPVHGSSGQLLNAGNTRFNTHVDYNVFIASVAMGIDWMNLVELCQAIPPIYTYWLGRRLRKWLQKN